MNYSKKDIALAIVLMFFIISFAVIITVFFKPLYYFDINYLQIDKLSGFDIATIKENYSILIDYQSIFYRGTLNLPDFTMSTSGRIHFEEVKRIFEFLQIMMVITGITGLIGIYRRFKIREYRFLKLTGLITIIVPLIIGFLAALDFNRAFIIFHQLVFRNDFWIFDYLSDPVIMILPESFFMHCFIMIVLLIVLLSGLCLWYYYRKQKQVLTS